MSKKSLFITFASILLLIATFLEWGTGSVGGNAVYHFNGIDSNQGKISLILAILIGIFSILSYYIKKQAKLFNISILIISVANLVLLLMTIFKLNDIISLVNQLKGMGVSASLGIGIILSLVISFLILVLNLLTILKQDETKKVDSNIESPHNKVLEKFLPVLVPLISVVLGILLGAIIMWIFGYDAIWGYEELFKTAFGSLRSLGEISRAMGPLMLIALGFAVASRAGFFNVGLPGQALGGWILAGWFALSFPDIPRPLMLIMTVLLGMIAGGVIGAIPGILRAYLGTSEVIVTIMMNYIVLYLGNAFIHSFPKSVMQSIDSSVTVSANATYQTEWLRALTNNSRMNIGIFFAIIAVVLVWFLLKKTTLGYEIRSVGINPHASEYAGMSAKRTIILSMIISGALAGVGGVVEGLGTFQNVYVQGSSLSIGFNGMAVSLLASNSPVGIPFAAFLFAVLQVGAPGMNVATIPSELVSIVTASIIFFVSVHYIIERFIKPRKQEKGGK